MLRKENNDLKAKVKTLNEKLNSPSEEVVRLEKEIKQLKEHHEKRILEDSDQVLKAEINLKGYIEKNEKRTAALESEIAELYRVVASYENKKYRKLSLKKQKRLFLFVYLEIQNHENHHQVITIFLCLYQIQV